MSQHYWRTNPDAPFVTLVRVAGTYCHPEADEEAYDSLKHLVKQDSDEMRIFKHELRRALQRPDEVPVAILSQEVQYDDGSAEKFLRRLWRDLYPDEANPADPAPDS